MVKAVCVTLALRHYKNWEILYKNCVNSWKRFHPDIEHKIVYDEDVGEWSDVYDLANIRLKYCRDMFDKGYDKVFMTGLDVFCTARWDEFLNDNETPLLATSGACYCLNPDIQWRSVFSARHNLYENSTICCDLTCFNKKFVIDDVLALMERFHLHDNDGIDLYVNQANPSNCKVVDFPYYSSEFMYGWKGHRVLGAGCVKEDGSVTWGCDGPRVGIFSPTTRWMCIDDKLYNTEGKYVKSLFFAKNITPENVHHHYNKETIEWLKNVCDIDLKLPSLIDFHNDFYNGDYSINKK
jgi:hypothetical protein